MYAAKVFSVSIVSSGIALEEEHIARESLSNWNIEHGVKSGVVFQIIPNNYNGITPDIFFFAIDNFVDKTKVDAAIAMGSKVVLLFNEYHDEENTIPAELKDVEALKIINVPNCIKSTYNGRRGFQETFVKLLSKIVE